MLRTARPPRRLLLYVILTSGVLAALLVNDMICFIFTPLVVVVVRGDLPLLAYPLALATSAILGSVANIIGVEPARDHVEVGFWNYAKFGFPVTGLTTAAGMLILAVSS